MRSIHLSESKQSLFLQPFTYLWLLNPVTCNSKITICFACLPSITGKANGTTDDLTLQLYQNGRNENDKEWHTFSRSQRAFIYSLDKQMICLHICFWDRCLTPLVPCAVISTIFLNLGCSSTWISFSKTWRPGYDDMEYFVHTWSVSMSHSIAASWKSSSLYDTGFSSTLAGAKWLSTADCQGLRGFPCSLLSGT